MHVHGTIFTAAVSGTTMKQVHCQKCGNNYQYRMVRRGRGETSAAYNIGAGSAGERAARKAERALQRLLERGVDPVPCPYCGWMQSDMVREVHRRRYGWLVRLGKRSLLASSPFLLLATAGAVATHGHLTPFAEGVVNIGLTLFLSGALLLLVILPWLRARSDPNASYVGKPRLFPGSPPAIKTGETEEQAIAAMTAKIASEPAGTWQIVQRMELKLPKMCCSCLEPAQLMEDFFVLLKLPLPICRLCRRRFDRRRLLYTVAVVTGTAVIGFATAMTLGWIRDEKRDLVPVVFLCILLSAACGFASRLITLIALRPASVRRIVPELGTVELRFKNAGYHEAFVALNPFCGADTNQQTATIETLAQGISM
jgi:hypothetical protein